MFEKETAREATSLDIPSRKRYGSAEAGVSFTIMVSNRSGKVATKGSVTVHDTDTGDAAGVLFGSIPSGSTDGRTVQIAGLPEAVVIHFECGATDQVWNGALSGPNIPNPVIINLT